jgi:hypothetical protein
VNAEPRAGQRILAAARFGKEFNAQRSGADKSVWIARRLPHFGRRLFAERLLCADSVAKVVLPKVSEFLRAAGAVFV